MAKKARRKKKKRPVTMNIKARFDVRAAPPSKRQEPPHATVSTMSMGPLTMDMAAPLLELQAKHTRAGNGRWWWLQQDSLRAIVRELETEFFVLVDGYLQARHTRHTRTRCRRTTTTTTVQIVACLSEATASEEFKTSSLTDGPCRQLSCVRSAAVHSRGVTDGNM